MASETPGNLGVRGNVLEARPGDVVGGVADAKHGIEQLLDQAASPCALVMPAAAGTAVVVTISAELDLSIRCLKPRFQSHSRAWDYICVYAETLERVPHPFDIRVLNLK